MCRSATIHGRSASGSAGRRSRPPAASERVELLELLRDRGERLCLGLRGPARPSRSRSSASSASRAAAAAARSGCVSTPARAGERAAGRRGLERDAAESLDARHEDRGRVQDRRPRRARPGPCAGDARREAARDGRPADQRARAQQHDLPVRELVEREEDAAGDDALVRPELDDDALLLGGGGEQRRVHAGREHPIVAGEPELGRCADVVRQCDQRVEAGEELLALGARGRVAEPVRRGERGHGERVGVAEREVGERRDAGIEAVDDVEGALGERLVQVRLYAHRHAELRAARHGDGRPDREDVAALAGEEGAAAREQIACCAWTARSPSRRARGAATRRRRRRRGR